MKSISVLIADDEPNARRYLESLLKHDDELTVFESCKNGAEVLRFCKNLAPDILFLDIEMPGINGLEVARSLEQTNTLIVFTTAYDQYAVEAFRVAAVDYLLKPFDEKMFFNVLNKVKQTTRERALIAQHQERLSNWVEQQDVSENSPLLEHFIIKEKGLEVKIKLTQVLYLESSAVYVIMHTVDGQQKLYRTALALLEKQLPPNFWRIHRSVIINSDFIESHKYLNNSKFYFVIKGGKSLESGRSYRRIIASKLGELNN
ncbi:MAG: response regulator transcription factor [Cyclobacteriaceae bacterium]